MSELEQRLWADFKSHLRVFDYEKCLLVLATIERLREIE